jgi:hypothetical protein
MRKNKSSLFPDMEDLAVASVAKDPGLCGTATDPPFDVESPPPSFFSERRRGEGTRLLLVGVIVVTLLC